MKLINQLASWLVAADLKKQDLSFDLCSFSHPSWHFSSIVLSSVFPPSSSFFFLVLLDLSFPAWPHLPSLYGCSPSFRLSSSLHLSNRPLVFSSPLGSFICHLPHPHAPLSAAAHRTSTAPPSPRWALRPWHHASCCGNSWCGSSFRSRSGGSSRGSGPPSTRKPLPPRPQPLMSISPSVYHLLHRCQWRCLR